MRTYNEFISVLEQVTGATLGFRKTFGAPIGSSTAVTGSIQGKSAQGTQSSVSGSLGGGTVSGQGDKINKGISASISNTQSGGGDKEWKGVPYRIPNADTSTSSIRQGAVGSLSANVSGGGAAKPASKPEPTKPEPTKPEPTKPNPPERTQPTVVKIKPESSLSGTPGRATPQPTTPSLIARGYTDDRNNPYPGSVQKASELAQNSPNPAVRAQAAQDYKTMRGLETQFKNERLTPDRASGVKPVVRLGPNVYGTPRP
jgi:hypothetical protein